MREKLAKSGCWFSTLARQQSNNMYSRDECIAHKTEVIKEVWRCTTIRMSINALLVRGEGEIGTTLQRLFGELGVLAKILYRNSNQHGRSRALAPLKTVNRIFEVTTQARIALTDAKSMESLSKASERRGDEPYIAGLQLSLKGLDLLCEAFNNSILQLDVALLGLVEQLRKRVFAPLYSMLLALSSRLYTICQTLSVRFQQRRVVVLSRLEVRTHMLCTISFSLCGHFPRRHCALCPLSPSHPLCAPIWRPS